MKRCFALLRHIALSIDAAHAVRHGLPVNPRVRRGREELEPSEATRRLYAEFSRLQNSRAAATIAGHPLPEHQIAD